MKIEFVDPELLKSAAYNPRQISREELNKLIKSIKQFGFVDPALVRKQDNMIVGGHQRIKAAQELGLKEIPVVYLDITENDAKLLNVALNKISGDWDEDKLTELLAELKFFDDVDELLTGFDEDELDQLIADLEEPKEGLTDDDAVPEEVETICKEGQLWQLGDHRLLCGDATNEKNVDLLMDGNKADMVFTDPPYNMDYDFNDNGMVQTGQREARFGKIKNDNMSVKEFDNFVNKTFLNIHKNINGGSSYYISGRRESTISFNNALDNLDFHIQSWLVWKKENFNISRFDYHPKSEILTYGWKKGSKHNWYGDRSQTDVLEFSREIGASVHPTQKPIELIEYCLKNSSKKGNVILDLFLGSGSTLIACEKTNRKCYGMELDHHYCDVIIKRWEDYTGQKAELLNGSL
jgi:DNA modification methylase